MLFVRISFSLFLWLIIGLEGVNSQSLEKELYALDIEQVSHLGTSETARAMYWVDIVRRISRENPSDHTAKGLLFEIDILIDEMSNATPGEEWEAAHRAFRNALTSPKLTERIFEELGFDKLSAAVISRVKATLEVESKRLAKNSTSAAPSLAGELLTRYLKISDEQSDRIADVVSVANEKLLTNEFLTPLRELSDQRWNSILEVLNPSQRKEAKRLAGRPIEWFRIGGQSELLETGFLEASPSFHSHKASELGKVGVRLDRLNDVELEKNGIFVVQGVCLAMVFDRFIWDEVSLSDSQRESIAGDFQDELRDSGWASAGGDMLYFHQLLVDDASLPDNLAEILDEEQEIRFRQIEFQILTGKAFQPCVGIIHPVVYEHLNLSHSQRVDIKRIADEFEKDKIPLTEQLSKFQLEVKKHLEMELLDVLHPHQLVMYQELKGIIVPRFKAN